MVDMDGQRRNAAALMEVGAEHIAELALEQAKTTVIRSAQRTPDQLRGARKPDKNVS
jgi:hypothetical protein